jgi:quercetin dioxygenase-like cupin family protein
MGKNRIAVGAMGVRFLVEASDSNGSLTMFEVEVPADARMPAPHSHDGFEETIFGLAGRATYTVGGETIEIDPGDSICIQRGVVHSFANHGSSGAKFLAIVSPGLFGPDYFIEIGEIVDASTGGPPDLAAIGEVMRRHGLTPA